MDIEMNRVYTQIELIVNRLKMKFVGEFLLN